MMSAHLCSYNSLTPLGSFPQGLGVCLPSFIYIALLKQHMADESVVQQKYQKYNKNNKYHK